MNLDAIVTVLDNLEGLTGNVKIGQPAQIEGIANGPFVWITDAMESAPPSERINTPSIQRIECRVGLAIGATTFADMAEIRETVRWALIDLYPDGEPGDPMAYRGGRLDFVDPGWAVWRDEYSYAYYVDMLNKPVEPEPVPEEP